MTKFRDDMSVEERFAWHSEVYAWRRVRLGVSHDERTSPPDPQGVWFNAGMVDAAEQRLREKLAGTQAARTSQHDDQMRAEAESIKNQWARDHGYYHFEDYLARSGLDYEDACAEVCRSLLAGAAKTAAARGRQAYDEPPDADPKTLLKSLNPAKERIYDKDELRRARAELGGKGMPPDPHDDLLPPGLDANGRPTGEAA